MSSPTSSPRRKCRRRSSSSSSSSSSIPSPMRLTDDHRRRSKSTSLSQESTKIVQVTNVTPQVTREMLETLFGHLGSVEDMIIYPTQENFFHAEAKVAFIKFRRSASVSVALRLTNTCFIDRALIVLPYFENNLPDDKKVGEMLLSDSLFRGIPEPKLPQHVTSHTQGVPALQVVLTRDPTLIDNELPQYPPLHGILDTRKINEIRKTLLVCDLPENVPSEKILELFSSAGEVKYFRACTRNNDPLQYALIEFSEQESIIPGLKMNGTTLKGKTIRVFHAIDAIVKPQAKSDQAAQDEIAEAISNQAQNMISDHVGMSYLQSTSSSSRGKGQFLRSGVRMGDRDRIVKLRSRSSSTDRISRSSSKRRRSRSRSRSRRRRTSSRSRRSRSRSRNRQSQRSRSIHRIKRNPRSGSRNRHRHTTPSVDRDRKKRASRESTGKVAKVKKRKDRKREKEHSKSKSESKRQRRHLKSVPTSVDSVTIMEGKTHDDKPEKVDASCCGSSRSASLQSSQASFVQTSSQT